MIITLSPAKLQNFEKSVPIKESTKLLFPKESEELISELKPLSADEVAKLMSISPKQAMEVYQHIQAFDMPRTSQKQAAFAYNGIAYKGLDAYTLSEQDWMFGQEHLLIISGLYGALRPLDLIKPYRLEFVIKLANSRGKDLYQYWTDELTRYFSERLEKDDKVWLNVASHEYTKAINQKNLPKGTKMVTAVFKEQTPQGPKMKVVYAKKARGMMARYVIQNKIKKLEDVKGFDTEGYQFSPSLSSDKEWVFLR